jgi:uncharacterized membrane protein YhaH (DUF805 family)
MNWAQIFVMYSLQGRAGRKEFLITHGYVSAIALVIIIFMSGLLPGSLGGESADIWLSIFLRPMLYFMLFKGATEEYMILLCICGAVWLFFAATLSAVAVRRLHDRGRTGFWILLVFGSYFLRGIPKQILFELPISQQSLPYVLEVFRVVYVLAPLAYLVELGLYPGQRGGNKFGPEPLESELNRT